MVILPAKSNVLAGHVIESDRTVHAIKRITWILGEVRRARDCGRSIDGRQQHEITSRVVDSATTKGQTELVLLEPETVVGHEADEVLRGRTRLAAAATHSATAFTPQVRGKAECGLIKALVFLVIVLDRTTIALVKALQVVNA